LIGLIVIFAGKVTCNYTSSPFREGLDSLLVVKFSQSNILFCRSAWDDPILKKTQKKTLLNSNHLKEVEEQEEEEEGEGEEASKLIESKM